MNKYSHLKKKMSLKIQLDLHVNSLWRYYQRRIITHEEEINHMTLLKHNRRKDRLIDSTQKIMYEIVGALCLCLTEKKCQYVYMFTIDS